MGRFHRWWRTLPVGLLVVATGLAAGPTQAGSPTPTPTSSSPWAAGSPQVSSSLPPKMAPSPRALSGETVTLLDGTDTFVVSNFPDYNFNGFRLDFDGDVNLFLVGNHYLTGIQRGFLQFDLSSIPAGSRINSATLYAFMYVYWNPAGPVISISAQQVISPWEESSVTWNSQPYYGEAYGSALVGTEFTWYAWDITALVQGWVSASYPNFGLMLRGPEAGGTDLKGFVAREQGDDWAPRLVVNFTRDTIAPTSRVQPLPPFSRYPVTVRWSGSDNEGGSGLANYDVQYRVGEDWRWFDWLLGTTDTSATFYDGKAGHTYYLRSRARDNDGNMEEYPTGDGDTHTTLYTYQLSGTVRDNRGAPLAGTAVHISPSPLFAPTTNTAGGFFAYLTSPQHSLHTTRSGYGDLPAMTLNITADTTGTDLYLLPIDDLAVNGSFEAGNFGSAWIIGGAVAPTVDTNVRHTGGYAAMFGQPPSWSPVENVSNSVGASEGPDIAADDGGTLHMVWSDSTPGNWDILYASKPAGGDWTTPVNISNTSGSSRLPAIAVDGVGTLHVVWSDGSSGYDGYDEIYYANKPSGGAWSSPLNISNTPGSSGWADIVVDSAGTLHVVWSDSTPGNWDIFYASKPAGGDWTTPVNISNTSGTSGTSSSGGPAIAVDGVGTLHVVWPELVPIPGQHPFSQWDIYYANKPSGGAWAFPLNISNTLDFSTYHAIAVDGTGTLHVVWTEESAVYYVSKPIGGNWSVPTLLSESWLGPDAPAIAVDGIGTPHVAWVSIGSGNREILYTNGPSGRSRNWSIPSKVSGAVPIQGGGLAILAKGRGVLDLAWQGYTLTSNKEIFYTHLQEGETRSSHIAQVITLPGSLHRPTLSFLYQLTTGDTNDWFEVTITSGITATRVFSTATSTDWTQKWVDLTPWAGETITITFNVHETANDVLTWVYLDEVSVGSHLTPQVSEVSPTRRLPGSIATITITGTNFISVPTVLLGTIPFPDVGYVSSEVLTATVPSTLTLGLYDVTVRNPGGQEGLLPNSFHAGYSVYMPMITRLYSGGW